MSLNHQYFVFKPALENFAGVTVLLKKVSQTFANIADYGPICPKPEISGRLTSGERFPL